MLKKTLGWMVTQATMATDYKKIKNFLGLVG